ncbi:MAG: sulfate adenylyltransferase subunit CysD [Candidatus Micrarchaeota archaeon]|nr:sulfate adenylyltransferase subunit CysD [Candidatus Micrarchaeota archaeon]
MIEQDLNKLEEKSIYLIREANAKFKKIGMLWSMGKDSTTMVSLVRKAFLGKVPFPVIHIDNGIDFPETYKFRDDLVKKWNMKLIVAKSRIQPEMTGFSCCGSNKTVALKKLMDEEGFDAIIVSIRRDEHGIRSKERYMSLRDKDFKWNYKDQKAELWNNYTTKTDRGEHIRIHPLLDWNEIDIWNYIMRYKVPLNPLYFSKEGQRFRSLGCTHCTNAIKSNAKTVEQIVDELRGTKEEERAGRQQDKEKAYIMEKLRALGYM